VVHSTPLGLALRYHCALCTANEFHPYKTHRGLKHPLGKAGSRSKPRFLTPIVPMRPCLEEIHTAHARTRRPYEAVWLCASQERKERSVGRLFGKPGASALSPPTVATDHTRCHRHLEFGAEWRRSPISATFYPFSKRFPPTSIS
jgi:hypothetical protein